jgi:hypothetical protein
MAILLLGVGFPASAPARNPTTYEAMPCKVAPKLDGIDSTNEWSDATRVNVSLVMRSPKSSARRTRQVRRAELRCLNSAQNLYIALRIPDASQQLDLEGGTADLVVLTFCRDDQRTEGDHRRVALPGAYADRRFHLIGEETEFKQRNGTGAMRWSKTQDGGEYFIEWRLPLRPDDPGDLSAALDGRLRFNLVFWDHFSPKMKEAKVGGLFGPETEFEPKWGTLVLAENPVDEASTK